MRPATLPAGRNGHQTGIRVLSVRLPLIVDLGQPLLQVLGDDREVKATVNDEQVAITVEIRVIIAPLDQGPPDGVHDFGLVRHLHAYYTPGLEFSQLHIAIFDNQEISFGPLLVTDA
jgi:hypothetical protein